MPKLVVRAPSGDELTIALCCGQALTVGRLAENGLHLDHESVSRRHAQLDWDEESGCRVEDLHSSNGTLLNGLPLTQATVLQDGDRLRFGAITAIFYDGEGTSEQVTAASPAMVNIFAERFRILGALAEASEYQTFRAEDSENGCQVSLRLFHPDVIANEDQFLLAKREFSKIQRAPAHPGLVKLLEFDRWRSTAYLTAEWIEGYPLLDTLCRDENLEYSAVADFAGQAAEVTDYARLHALIPPDLNPLSTLVTFEDPIAGDQWRGLLARSIKEWPPATLRFTPRIIEAPAKPGPTAIGAFLCELLGHPVLSTANFHPTPIPSLGEAGNATLMRGLTSPKAFENDLAFVEALSRDFPL